ncbi:RAD52 DNA repair protein [Tricharina praecox]|uniref:RAD52 DNA repair protein n=1 Tax=Tricharina praecox TaxID=43433 RepID=UPI00221FA733|nr:RAD52 DNA repair protein [Tricharina praecox]KAI5857923.1 RAD52 DNA repair protein [Tricharina praecox]
MHPGDQHKLPGYTQNPYEEKQISPYTAIEIATLQAKLDQQLGPEFISSRPGAGGKKVHYIQAEKCINLANQVFGFNGWSSSITNMEVDFLDQSKDSKWSIGISVTVRVTLKDGTFHEDVGYGQMENGKKAQVFEKAKKEGTTDGLKRALRSFGNVLGNCLYDKDYLAKITRVKAPPTVFNEKRLHRHGDEMKPSPVEQQTVKNESVTAPPTLATKEVATPLEPFDEYGGDELEELGIFAGDDSVFDDVMPDEVAVDVRDNSPIDTPSKPAPVQSTNYTRPQPQQPPQSPTKMPQPRQQPAPVRSYAPPPPIAAPLRPGQGTNLGPQQGPGPHAQSRPVSRPPAQGPQGRPGMPPTNRATPGATTTPRPQQPPQAAPRAQPPPQAALRAPPPPQAGPRQQPPAPTVPRAPQPPPQAVPRAQPPPQPTNHQPAAAPIDPMPQPPSTPSNIPHNPPIGFFTGRAAMNLKSEQDMIPDAAPAFNPHRPTTLPRSAGIDHSKSSPVPRKVLQQGGTPNFQHPSLTPGRQIGMPPGRGGFRAPGLAAGTKRSADATGGRPALGNTPGHQLNGQPHPNGGNDPKRPRN